ncbi:filament-like protein [Actinidia rufa]|uniref:Filament-like protein n=1 Tax=Actinidia rufa TaxID=165716 RepID=A0A7J0DIP9_9ERIC|nr:filament-like protein [Actinidia rufa]
MDKRSWPWKKKSSDKAKTDKSVPASDPDGALAGSLGGQDNYKKQSYVQISMDSYLHLTGLEHQVNTYEDQVKNLEDQVKELNEKLSGAQTEMTNKDKIVKQHAKVAEEAVSGWEKAEAEALALKNHLESLELEAKIGNLGQELLRSEAENAALSRSLQERSNMLVKIREEKSQAEEEIELLKSNMASCEKEINSLKYELHIVAKELEIRNEEKNMSVRSADVANKQHLEGVRKIAKLEAECQRLRGLVRKKLPGPAALAQMKLEVESLDRDYGETRVRRSPVKPPSPHLFQLPEFSLDNVQKFQKDNEFLTERLLAMEEETKMLKEALAKRNSEVQASRNICAKTVSKLQSLESQLQANNQQTSPSKPILQIPTEASFSQNAGSLPSLTSLSEDGKDDEGSCGGSWATTLISEVSHCQKQKNIEKSKKAENANRVELMDDFLEMEKMANLSNESNGAISDPDVSNNIKLSLPSSQCDVDSLHVMKLRSRISMLFESTPKDSDMEKILDDMRCVLQETLDSLHLHSMGCALEESRCSEARGGTQACPEGTEVTEEKEISLFQDSKSGAGSVHPITKELEDAISRIHEFALALGNEAMAIQGTSHNGDGLSQKIQEFSASFDNAINNKINLLDFVVDLSSVLNEANELHFKILGYNNNEAETSSSDCIDKVVLPENKVVHDTSREGYPNGCAHFSDSISDPDIPHEGSFQTFKSNAASWKCSLEEFEQLKLEKDNLVLDLARCSETLESTKNQLQEMEQLLAEVKSQLASAHKLNSLSETQLKCMAESYKSLETRTEELQIEVNLLRAKTETLGNELQEERRNHQDALAKCKDLQEQLQRLEPNYFPAYVGTAWPSCPISDRNESCAVADSDVKNNQERDLAAATEKLAECQESIFLLGKQLKALRPRTEFLGSPINNERNQKNECFTEEEPTINVMNLQDFDQTDMDSANLQRVGSESPMDIYTSLFSPSDTEANTLLGSPISSKHPKHRPTKSGSSSLSSTPTPEKHSRGFSRFFSSKGKNGD